MLRDPDLRSQRRIQFGEGVDSTGIYIDGASPTIPAADVTSSGVNLHTTDVFNVQISYDGTNLTMTITDTMTNATLRRRGRASWVAESRSLVVSETRLQGKSSSMRLMAWSAARSLLADIKEWTLNY